MGGLLGRMIGRGRRAGSAAPECAGANALVLVEVSPGAFAVAGPAGVRRWCGVPLLWWALLLLAAALAGLGYQLLPEPGKAAALRPVRSVMAMMSSRSPGERAGGDLIDSKPALATAAPTQRALGKVFGPPQQRALGKVFAPPTGLAPPGGGFAFAPPFQPGTLDLTSLPLLPGLGGAPGAPWFSDSVERIGDGAFGGGPGGFAGGGGGGGGIGGGTIPVGPPVAAVPEPATWLLMIIAFGLCGSMLRRHRRILASQSQCASAA